MQQLLEMFLAGGLRLPAFDSDLLALDRDLPKSEVLALLMLHRRGEAIMSDLAGDLGVPLSTATGIGARLERRGLIQRERHPDDRRVVLLRLTPEGQALADCARAYLDGLLARVMAALTPDEMQQLIGLVQKVMLALQAPAPEKQAGTAGQAPRRIVIEE